MTIIHVARPKDAEALLTLAKAFATSFVVDLNAFRVAFAELLALPSGYLAVCVRLARGWAALSIGEDVA